MKGAVGAVAPLPASPPVLEVKDLRTYFFVDEGVVRAVDGVTFEIRAGETLGIVGESGSGKTVSALSIMRLLQEPSRIVGGEVRFRGRNLVSMSEEELRALRGDGLAMVFQDPMTSLNPVLRIARQLVETMQVHSATTDAEGLQRAVTLLGRMGIPTPDRAVDNYPHQFSGGMRQRVMLAMGFSNDPGLLIADEPTTALDVTVQAQILDLLRRLNAESGTAILLISHDLGVIAAVCSRVVVMYAGEVVEEGSTADLLSDPQHPYTWALLNAAPRLDQPTPADRHLTTIEGTPPNPMNWPSGCRFLDRCPFKIDQCTAHPPLESLGAGRKARCWLTQGGQRLPSLSGPGRAEAAAPAPVPAPAQEKLLELRGLKKHFPVGGWGRAGGLGVVHAVDGVDLDVFKGETVGLVGESGCGKSTLARLVVRLQRPTAGAIRFEGRDIAQASDADIRPLRRRMQMIFQDPYASLNPRMKVGDTLAEPIRFHRLAAGERAISARVDELLGLVGLPSQAAAKFPHEFSGGQRQRVAIARALAVQPEFIVADEPISSLDVNIQAQIINLLVDLQSRLGLTYLFIAHDLAVVRHISDRVVVLYLGKVAEIASSANLFSRPLHPYTRSLIASVPALGGGPDRPLAPGGLRGEPPSAIDPPSGCRFRARCPIAQPVCATDAPLLIEHAPGQWASCHFPGQF